MSGDFDFIAGTSQIWGFIKDKDNRPTFIFAIFGGLLMAAATYFDLVTYLQWVLLVALGSIFYGIQEARKEIREVLSKNWWKTLSSCRSRQVGTHVEVYDIFYAAPAS